MCHNVIINDQITFSVVSIAVNAGIIALVAMIYSKGVMHFFWGGLHVIVFLAANRLIRGRDINNIA